VVADPDVGTSSINGLLSVDDVNERFGLELEDSYYNTIGGFVFGQLGRRPELGDVVTTDQVTLTVSVLDGLRIDRLVINRIPVNSVRQFVETYAPEADEQSTVQESDENLAVRS